MSYSIFYSDPAKYSYPIVVQDEVQYNGVGTGGLTLVGRNFPTYGQSIAENFIHLLENSSNTFPPVNPIEGQLWFDSGTKKLRINDGAASNANWKPINGLFQQETEPTNVSAGDIWVDTYNYIVKFYTGSIWKPIGDQSFGSVESGAVPLIVEDVTSQPHYIIKNIVGGNVVSVIASEAFIAKNVIDGFSGSTTLQFGVNLAEGAIFNGTSYSSNNLKQNGISVNGNSFLRKDLNQTLYGQFTIATDGNALRIGTDPTFIIERNNSVANFVNSYNSYGSFAFNIKNNNAGNIKIVEIGGNPTQVKINSQTTASSTSTGALVVGGGVGIGGDLIIGGNLLLTNTVNTVTVANIIVSNSATISNSVSIGGNLNLRNELYINANKRIWINGLSGVSGQVLITDGTGVRWAALAGTTQPFFINNSTTSINTTTGALTVSGGVGIGGNLYVDNDLVVVSATSATNVVTKIRTNNNVPFDTVVSFDNLQARVTTGGIVQINSVSGILDVAFSALVLYNPTPAGVVNRFSSLSTWTPVSNTQLTAIGSSMVVHIQNITEEKIYRLTCLRTSSPNSASLIVERLI